MSISTLGRVIRVSADRVTADQPLGAGLAQILASNAVHLARENGLRTLAEHPGSATDAWRNLLVAGDVNAFPWDFSAGDGTVILCTGPRLVRFYGETVRAPRFEARWRWKAPSGYTAGAILLVTPGLAQPDTARHPYVTTTTTSTSLVDASLTLTLDAGLRQTRERQVYPAAAADETGTVHEACAFLGWWCTSNQGSDPVVIRGASIFLREPA